MAITPYVVGQWVRDDRFYGREGLLAEILEGQRNCLWLLGTRRIGKTSILKQVEFLTSRSPDLGFFPLFWDFQGSEVEEDLHDGFRDALVDALERFDRIGLALEEVEREDLFESLTLLRRGLHARGQTLLILGDEAEELVNLQDSSPRFLRRLGRALQSPEHLRTVLASTVRLWGLASTGLGTSPMLQGFTPPLPVRGLGDEAARALLRQSKLPSAARPKLDEKIAEEVRVRCSNHPFLLQLLGERFQEVGNLERAVEEISADQMVSFFFAADLAMLSDTERRVLEQVESGGELASGSLRERLWEASGDPATGSSPVAEALHRLEILGLLQRGPEGGYILANPFFRRWLATLSRAGAIDPGAGNGSGGVTAVIPPPAGAPPVSRAMAEPAPEGRLLGDRYRLLCRLGLGATGEVYKAEDTLLRTTVAIKILRPEYSADGEAVERLRREVVLARDLSHPNILRIYHLGDEGGRRYITMRFIDGPDLAEVIAEDGSLPWQRVVSLGAKIASALEALHRRGLLHRDVKPSNVLLDAGGEPLLTDFGLARLTSGPYITRTGVFVGTPAFASPEQVVGKDLDERSDLYSLGVVLYQMATGRPLFFADSVAEILRLHLKGTPEPPQVLVPGLPAGLADTVLRCLAKEPGERFQSAAELSLALRRVARGR